MILLRTPTDEIGEIVAEKVEQVEEEEDVCV